MATLVALLCLVWGSTWIVISAGLDNLPPFTSTALRFLVAALCTSAIAPGLSRREGAGRKSEGDRSHVEYSRRMSLKARHPVHVTFRITSGLKNLRHRSELEAVESALAAAADRFRVRIAEYVVISNHLHLICEVEDERVLTRAMEGLCVRIARGLDRIWSRAGSVFADRDHCRALKTPREVRQALKYVLQNSRHHGIEHGRCDPCSSGAWFDGWSRRVASARSERVSPLPRARTWWLAVGWRMHGLIDLLPLSFLGSTPDDRSFAQLR